jgi:hypothetical protein
MKNGQGAQRSGCVRGSTRLSGEKWHVTPIYLLKYNLARGARPPRPSPFFGFIVPAKILVPFFGKINQLEIHRQNPFWPTYRLLCTGSDSNDAYLHVMVVGNVSQDSGGHKSVVTQDLRLRLPFSRKPLRKPITVALLT